MTACGCSGVLAVVEDGHGNLICERCGGPRVTRRNGGYVPFQPDEPELVIAGETVRSVSAASMTIDTMMARPCGMPTEAADGLILDCEREAGHAGACFSRPKGVPGVRVAPGGGGVAR